MIALVIGPINGKLLQKVPVNICGRLSALQAERVHDAILLRITVLLVKLTHECVRLVLTDGAFATELVYSLRKFRVSRHLQCVAADSAILQVRAAGSGVDAARHGQIV